jgi:PIN domain nuclease of toxin-antitoxin system
MGAVVVDASVVLAVLDPADAHHGKAVHALRSARSSGNQIVLPASALAEVLVGASRIGTAAVRTTEAFVDSVVDVVADIDRDVARSAAGYRARSGALRLPDALVIAVGNVMDAEVLTADQRWAKVDRRIRVIR